MTTQLAENARQQASVAMVGAVIELVKHLRKCMQSIIEGSSPGHGANKCKTDLESALEKCILVLSNKVNLILCDSSFHDILDYFNCWLYLKGIRLNGI